MRFVVWAVLLLVLAAIAYTAWPLVNLYQLADAARSRDTVAFQQLADLPAITKSIARQIIDRASEGKIKGVRISVDPSGREIAANLLEARLRDVLTPEAVFDLLRRGRIGGGEGGGEGSGEGSGPRSGPPPYALPSNPLSRVKSLSFATLTTFQVSLGEGTEPNDWLTLSLRLKPPVWQLSGVSLPDKVFRRFQRHLDIKISGAR